MGGNNASMAPVDNGPAPVPAAPGSFGSLSGMEKLTLISQGVSSFSSAAGGFSNMFAANREADLLFEQGELARLEAREEANRRAEQVRKFAAKQKMKFLKSGVVGQTPLDVVDETLREGQKEVDALRRRGDALARLGSGRAQIARSKGRAALLGGLGKGFGSGINTFIRARQFGLFGGQGGNIGLIDT